LVWLRILSRYYKKDNLSRLQSQENSQISCLGIVSVGLSRQSWALALGIKTLVLVEVWSLPMRLLKPATVHHKGLLAYQSYLLCFPGLTRRYDPRLYAPKALQYLIACVQKRHWSETPRVQNKSRTNFPPFKEPTIYALSSAPGRAAIAIIRISGPASFEVMCHST